MNLWDSYLREQVMEERTLLQRLMQDNLLRWTTVASGFVLYVVVVSLIAIRTPQVAEYLAVIGFGLVAIHFIFTVSNEVRRIKQARSMEKSKRHHLELSDDGELVEVVDADAEKRKINER
jgi:hypothetical protein